MADVTVRSPRYCRAKVASSPERASPTILVPLAPGSPHHLYRTSFLDPTAITARRSLSHPMNDVNAVTLQFAPVINRDNDLAGVSGLAQDCPRLYLEDQEPSAAESRSDVA